jgi:hypothetical protein
MARIFRVIVLLAASTLLPVLAIAQTTRCEVFPPGGYVGVYTDSLAQDSTIVLAPRPGFWFGSLHILAVLNGAVAGGITAAEFRVHLPLAPGGMFITTTVDPDASISIGQPITIGMSDGGLRVAFPQCKHGEPAAGGKVVVNIARVDILSLVAFDTPVLVQKLAPPDFRAPCPNFRLCDPPIFTPAPMVSRGMDEVGEEYVFRGRLFCLDGQVGIAPAAWGAIKQLYR